MDVYERVPVQVPRSAPFTDVHGRPAPLQYEGSTAPVHELLTERDPARPMVPRRPTENLRWQGNPYRRRASAEERKRHASSVFDQGDMESWENRPRRPLGSIRPTSAYIAVTAIADLQRQANLCRWRASAEERKRCGDAG